MAAIPSLMTSDFPRGSAKRWSSTFLMPTSAKRRCFPAHGRGAQNGIVSPLSVRQPVAPCKTKSWSPTRPIRRARACGHPMEQALK